ncbi:MAG: 2-amino-4-hydroxy-6-hydroxymethyldihydropteridine diphosphokinase [Desulfovibrionaceae bacterium]
MGCNQGDCDDRLNEALARLDPYGKDIHMVALSEIYLTQPQGKADQPWFHNQVAHLRIDPVIWAAEGFMSVLLAIEAQMGRARTEPNGPRVIDMDLLLFGDTVMDSEFLTLPHPRLAQRAFMLVPLKELAPALVFPDGRTIDEVLAGVQYRQEGLKIWQDG